MHMLKKGIFLLWLLGSAALWAMRPMEIEPAPLMMTIVSSIEPENQRVPIYIDSRFLPFQSVVRMREGQKEGAFYGLAYHTPALQLLYRVLAANYTLNMLPSGAVNKAMIMGQLLNSPEVDQLIASDPLHLLAETRALFEYLQLPADVIQGLTLKMQVMAYRMWKRTGQEIEIAGVWPASFSLEELLDRKMITAEEVFIKDDNGNLIEINLQNARLSSLRGMGKLIIMTRVMPQGMRTCRKVNLSQNQLTSLESEIIFTDPYFNDLLILDVSENRLPWLNAAVISPIEGVRHAIRLDAPCLPGNLQELYAHHNNITQALYFLPQALRILDLSYNGLAAIPDRWTSQNLELCDLSHNNINQFATSVSPGSPVAMPNTFFLNNAPRLRRLNLSHNRLATLPYLFLSSSRDIEEVNLSHNSLVNLPFFVTRRQIQLAPDRPHELPLNPQNPQEQDWLRFLKKFDVSNNALPALPNPFLPEAPSLTELYLHQNQLRALPSSFCARSSGIWLITLEFNPFRIPAGFIGPVQPQLDLSRLPHVIADAIVRGTEYFEREIRQPMQAQAQAVVGESYVKLGREQFEKSKNNTDLTEARTTLERALEFPLTEEARVDVFVYLGDIARYQKDCAKALDYLQRAVNQTVNQRAQAKGLATLAKMYFSGTCVDQDQVKTFELLKQAEAIEPNDVRLLEILGRMYYEGRGVKEQNLPQAKQYFERARALGSKNAKVFLRKIEEEELERAGIRRPKPEGPETKKSKTQ